MSNWFDGHRTSARLSDFVAAGLVNTGLTFAVYESLLLVTGYRLAYAAAFIVGLIAASAMNVRLVFGKALTLRSVSRYGLYYCGYCALSLAVATLTVENFGIPEAWAPVPVLLLLTGPHFLASRWLTEGAVKKSPTHLSPDDIAQIAVLQVDLLRDSLVSRFGRRYAASYWRYVDCAEEEAALCIRAPDGTIAAACALSFAPATLGKRLLIRTPLLCHAFCNFFSPWLWAAMRGAVTSDRDAGPTLVAGELRNAAEVVMLMTHPQYRRRGHARALLTQVEMLLAKRGLTRYYVRTSDNDPAALDFYRNNGFVDVGYLSAHGSRFKLFMKAIGLPDNLTAPNAGNPVETRNKA